VRSRQPGAAPFASRQRLLNCCIGSPHSTIVPPKWEPRAGTPCRCRATQGREVALPETVRQSDPEKLSQMPQQGGALEKVLRRCRTYAKVIPEQCITDWRQRGVPTGAITSGGRSGRSGCVHTGKRDGRARTSARRLRFGWLGAATLPSCISKGCGAPIEGRAIASPSARGGRTVDQSAELGPWSAPGHELERVHSALSLLRAGVTPRGAYGDRRDYLRGCTENSLSGRGYRVSALVC
jgi:hypothetical protein